MRGKLITFEGCDGVGKSTQIALFKNYLEQHGNKVLLLREPGGNDISEKIRNIILDSKNTGMTGKCEALLYFAARAQLVETVIIPYLNGGTTIILDRYIDSSIAYQGFARNLGVDYINSLIKLTCADIMPDATIFLDLPPSQAFSRKGGAEKTDRIELENIEFHNRVYLGYHKAMELYPDRIVAVQPIGSIESTHSKIISALKAKRIIV